MEVEEVEEEEEEEEEESVEDIRGRGRGRGKEPTVKGDRDSGGSQAVHGGEGGEAMETEERTR